MKNLILFILISSSLCLYTSCGYPGRADDIKPFYLRTDGADLMVNIDGNTDSKVFFMYMHGGPGAGGVAYNQGYFSDMMEEDYAVVYLDQRGNGASQGNYDKEDLTIEQNSKDIYNLTLYLKAQYGDDISIFLAGHSWGGLTTAHALVSTDIQENLKGWIEIDGAHDYSQNDIETTKMFKQFATEEIANQNNVDFWQPVLDRVNQVDTLNISDGDRGYLNSTGFMAEGKFDLEFSEITSIIFPFDPQNPEAGITSNMANRVVNIVLNEDSETYSLTNRLDEIEIPSLFLWGKYDFVVPPAMGITAYNNVNTIEKEMYIFEASGHSPMANEGELFTEKVKAFIEKYK